jgi:hypothetical protein
MNVHWVREGSHIMKIRELRVESRDQRGKERRETHNLMMLWVNDLGLI